MTGWLAVAGAVVLAATPGVGWVEGVVLRAGTGEPIQGAEVVLGGAATTTDTSGYLILTLPPGVYPLTVAGLPVEEVPEVGVRAGSVTELIVVLDQEGRPAGGELYAPAGVVDTGPAEEGPVDAPPGFIRGVVTSEETGEPVAGARIFVRGLTEEVTTGAGGEFAVRVPAGTHDLSVLADGYSIQTRTELEVPSGADLELQLALPPSSVALETFRVRAPRLVGGTADLLAEQKASGAMSNIIGAEQFARSGDSSAADALKRVTGLSVVGGRFVYVRGLGERYSATVLNGSSLPSPEPERRVVPLDLIPAGMLDSVVIQKTYLPNQPGEFGGGVVQLRTRNFPSRPIINVSLGTAGRIGTTFADGLTYHGGKTDWLGFDDGTRALPEDVAAASEDQPLLERDMFSDLGYTAEELERLGEQMPNIWNVQRSKVPPDLSLGIALGNRFDLAGKRPLGVLLAASYGRNHTVRDERRTYYNLGAGGGLEKFHEYDFESWNKRVKGAILGTVALEFLDDNEIADRFVLNRVTDDETRNYQGENRDVGASIRVTRLRWVERTLLSNQASGSHRIHPLANFTVEWKFAYSRAMRAEPDRREYRYDQEDEDTWIISDRPEGNQRLYSTLVDNHYDLAVDLKMPIPFAEDREGFAGGGFQIVRRDREVDTRRFKFKHKGGAASDASVTSQDPESIFQPENIAPGNFQLEEFTRETDNYNAEQQIEAAYGMVDLPFHDRLRFVGGVRVERSRQFVSTFELFNPDSVPQVAELDTTDFLFGTNFIWDWTDTMGLRAAGARTVSRPDFRELSPAAFNDVTGGRLIFGNPELQRATIWHADLRWEWYPSPGEILSLGGFYKRLEDPIESIVVVSAQHSLTYENAEGANNVGGEFEVRKNFGFIAPPLADLVIGANVSAIYSQVNLGDTSGIETSHKRPLQGQSPFLINLILSYDNVDAGISLNLLYNVFGKRIAEVGAQGAPDVFEMPVHELDFTYRQKLGKGFELKFVAGNLIDPRVQKIQGDKLVSTYRRGRKFSLKLSWTLPEPEKRPDES